MKDSRLALMGVVVTVEVILVLVDTYHPISDIKLLTDVFSGVQLMVTLKNDPHVPKHLNRPKH